MTNEITIQNHTLKDLETMANVVARSGLFGVKDPTQAMALMLLCQADGLHPMTACRQYHVIQGRASMTSQTMMSRFLQSGGRQEIHELTEEAAELTLTHPQGGSARVRWTIQQAQKAGLAGKDNWRAHPRSMLLRRAQAEAVRAVAPFIVEGLPLEDEAADLPHETLLAPVKKDIDIDKLPAIDQPIIEMTDIMLDRDWDRDSKARATREAKRLGGSVSKEGIASVPTTKVAEFDDFIAEIAIKHFQASDGD
jgi:hypothetical protein